MSPELDAKNHGDRSFSKRGLRPNKMNKNRVKIYKESLNKLLERKDGNFLIIEDIETRKFVQFEASSKARQLLLDIPIAPQHLSMEQINKLNNLIAFNGDSIEPFSRGDPFQVSFINKTDYAAEIIERIFIEIFNLSNNYNVAVTLE